ncbi:MAG: hypothetical protein ACRCVJ_13960 [Clostridium sp.]|uniref:hypothetical protein n=1 Tax=Clostridium sp. TaxID=1506 RepID=UPI003F35B078
MNFKIAPRNERQYANGHSEVIYERLIACNILENNKNKKSKFGFLIEFRFSERKLRDIEYGEFLIYLNEIRWQETVTVKFRVVINDGNHRKIKEEIIKKELKECDEDNYICVSISELLRECNDYASEILIYAEVEDSAIAVFASSNTRVQPYLSIKEKSNQVLRSGPTGPPGPRGAQGPKGSQGQIGPQGIQGVEGDIGPIGPIGPTGPTGCRGIQGPTGITGVQGLQGPMGPTGSRGIQGPIGPTGNMGIQGPTGAIGPKGDQGIQGPTGPTGSRGIEGPIGPTGAMGIIPSPVYGSYTTLKKVGTTLITEPSDYRYNLFGDIANVTEGITNPSSYEVKVEREGNYRITFTIRMASVPIALGSIKSKVVINGELPVENGYTLSTIGISALSAVNINFDRIISLKANDVISIQCNKFIIVDESLPPENYAYFTIVKI